MKYYLFAILFFSVSTAQAQWNGGNKDGYAKAGLNNSTSIYLGGSNDGYKKVVYSNPNSIYKGKTKDGYITANYTNSISIYTGGLEDGYNNAEFANPFSIYLGETKDGYVTSNYSNPTSIYAGGIEDGYNKVGLANPISIYLGTTEDGHVAADYNNSISIYAGGAGDGYDIVSKFVTFIWTGAVGEGWNVTGNWSGGIVPNINSRVVIPSGVPNFPFVSAGLLAIGEDPSGLATFFSKQIMIDPSAEMTLRVNATMENYGIIDIQGSFYVLNSTIDAVKNLGGGEIIVRKNALMSFIN